MTPCFPSNLKYLCEKYKDYMREDILIHWLQAMNHNQDMQLIALVSIEYKSLIIVNKELKQLGMCALNLSQIAICNVKHTSMLIIRIYLLKRIFRNWFRTTHCIWHNSENITKSKGRIILHRCDRSYRQKNSYFTHLSNHLIIK